MIAGMTYFQIFSFFIVYSFLGWVTEVIFHAVVVGKILNRGFLNGPVCPVYGFGMLTVLAVTNTAEESGILVLKPGETDALSMLIVFFGGMVLATAVELIAGWLLDVCFHMRWWDYSDKPFNFHGYICLGFSVLWGVGTILVVYVLHPVIAKGESIASPGKYGWIILGILYMLYFADLAVTISVIIGLNRRLEELDRIRKSMLLISDRLSETIGEGSQKTVQVLEKGEAQAVRAIEYGQAQAAKAIDFGQAQAAKAIDFGQTQAAKAIDFGQAQAAKAIDFGQTQAAKAIDFGQAQAARAVGKGQDAAARTAELAGKSRDELIRRKNELQKRADVLYAELRENRLFGPVRLLAAFPKTIHRDYRETLQTLKDVLRDKTPSLMHRAEQSADGRSDDGAGNSGSKY